jgi:hypothetical protein
MEPRGFEPPGLVNASHSKPPYTQLEAVMLTKIFNELTPSAGRSISLCFTAYL